MNKRLSFAMAFAHEPSRADTSEDAAPRPWRITAAQRIGAYARAAKRLAPRRKTTLAAALIIAAGAALRLYAIGELPHGVHSDEASGLYDAWALLRYGIDRNGSPWPVHFIAWGSGLNALYPYIAMPFIWFAGLDITAYRLPMAISGIASLWLMWRTAYNAAGPKFALIPLLLLALSPWHIMATRWALESNILPFAVLISAYFLSRHDRHRFAIQAAAVAALSLSVYAYGTAYVFAPAFLAAAFAWLALNRALTPRRAIALAAIAAAITAPMITFLIVNLFDLDAIRILGATIPRYPGPARYEIRTFLFRGDWGGIIANIGDMARLLLGSPDKSAAIALPEWGVLPRLSIIAAAAGLGVIIHRAIARRDFSVHTLIALWFAAALATSALAYADANRMNLVWLPAIYLIAWGLASICRPRAALTAAAAAAVALSAVFAHQYFREYRAIASEDFRAGLDAAISRAIENAGENELIYISQSELVLYAHALYAAATPPRQYLETRVVSAPNNDAHRILAFDRFVFLSPLQRSVPHPNPARAQAREIGYRHIETAGVHIDGVRHYIFKLPKEAPDANALDPDKFASERYGMYLYAYPKTSAAASPANAGSIRIDAPLIQGEPDARAKFNLHLQDRELAYFKRPCDQYDTRQRFFLHIIPENIADIPDERRAHGFDNLDFWFSEYGALYGSQCVARVPLPNYPIAAIETGQTKQAREYPAFWRQSWNRLWTAELKF